VPSLGAEAHRQMELLERGRRVSQQTLYFDEDGAVTHPLRLKEDAQDYRYMPDPNIPPIIVSQTLLAEIKAGMPELSHQSRRRLAEEYGLKSNDVESLLGIDAGFTVGWDGVMEDGGVWYFEAVVNSNGARRDPKIVLNWFVSFS
jgi:aspartyl-tRNA(Asn)/glutamyl-tRNA(Gln) amidotransferase subunit B